MRTPKEDQQTKCWCPRCRIDLVSSDAFVSDKGDDGDNRVLYDCKRCGTRSLWNFDALVPVQICVLSPGS